MKFDAFEPSAAGARWRRCRRRNRFSHVPRAVDGESIVAG